MDNHLNLYFREIIYNNPSSRKKSVCGVFSYEALNIEEAKLGNLYLVGKISNLSEKKHKNFEFLLNLLVSVIKREFYSDHKKNTIEALESALQSANIYLADFTKKGHKEWIGNLDFTCLVFCKEEIHISQTGEMIIYLLRENAISNIARKFSKEKNKDKIEKTFLNIASGKIENNDKIIISTSNISKIISGPKIKDLCSNGSAEALYNFIKNNLEEISKFKNKKEEIDSLANLILEAKNKAPFVEKKQIFLSKKREQPISFDVERMLNSKSNKFNNIVQNKISNSSKLSFIIPLFKKHVVKYFIITFLFFIIILSPYLIQKFYYESKIDIIDELIKRTKEKTNKSEIFLTYQSQKEAKILLQQANALLINADLVLNKLPERAKTEIQEKFKNIQKIIQNQENSLNNVINITQIEKIADLEKNSFSFNPKGILKLENNIFLYELNSGFLYRINLEENNSSTLIFLSSKDTFKLGTIKENALILLSNPEKVYVYSKNENYNTYLLKPDVENTLNIKDMTNYDNKIYLLDTKNLAILKYIPEENSLTGTNWLNESFKEELIDAQSLTIDGSIYVSKNDGTIIQFANGNKVGEFKPKVSPEINKGGEIFTNSEMKNIYILDSENKRIITINKNDGTSTQYISSEFNKMTDFWIANDEKTIFLLDGLNIYKINI